MTTLGGSRERRRLREEREYAQEALLASFEQNCLEVGRLRREGRLLMRTEEGPLSDRRGAALARLPEEEGEKGRTGWDSFNWVKQLELETALEQHKRLTELVEPDS